MIILAKRLLVAVHAVSDIDLNSIERSFDRAMNVRFSIEFSGFGECQALRHLDNESANPE